MILKSKNGKDILIDEEDYNFLSRFNWTVTKNFKMNYAFTTIFVLNKRTMIGMHRLIMGLRKAHIDHINRNGLDNRKSNLRYVTRSQNMANRRFKNRFAVRGVNRSAEGTWYARIKKDKIQYHLGTFKSIEEAAKAYDKKAFELYGQYAELNYPGEIYK